MNGLFSPIFYLTVVFLGIAVTVGVGYSFYKWGWKALILIGAIYIASIPFRGFTLNDVNILSPVLLGLVLGYTFRYGKSLVFYTVVASVSVTILSSGVLLYMTLAEDYNHIEALKTKAKSKIEQLDTSEENREELVRNAEMSFDFFSEIILFLVFLGAVIISALSFLVFRRIFTKTNDILSRMGLEYFHINDYLIFLVIGAGLSSILLFDKIDYYNLYLVSINILLIAVLFFIIQALGIVKYFFLKRGLPTSLIPLLVMLILVVSPFITIFSGIMLAGVGALDIWADFRKIRNAPVA